MKNNTDPQSPTTSDQPSSLVAETYQSPEQQRIAEEHAHADYLTNLMVERLRAAVERGELPKVN